MSFLYTILLILIPTFFFGLTNMVDNKLTKFDALKKTSTMVFLCSITNVLFMPVLFFIHPLIIPPLSTMPFLFLIGIIEASYLFPYFKSYQYLDTSIVAALFSLGRVFTPFLAFLMVKETFDINQYIGFLMVIIASVFLSLEKGKKFKLNIGFWLMLLASFLVVFEDVVIKNMTFNLDWVNLVFWSGLFASIASMFLLINKENRQDIAKALRWKSMKNYAPYFLLTEFFQGIARSLFILVISILPITFVETGMSFQPILIIITSYLLTKLFKYEIWEQKTSYMRKIICFVIMSMGVLLLV